MWGEGAVLERFCANGNWGTKSAVNGPELRVSDWICRTHW